jgi:hypothetical protein
MAEGFSCWQRKGLWLPNAFARIVGAEVHVLAWNRWQMLNHNSSMCRGFQLLAKMGYKAGKGIGKDGQGRAAPINLDLKADRTGLGVDEEKKRKQQGYRQLQELRSELSNRHCKASVGAFCLRAHVLMMGSAQFA